MFRSINRVSIFVALSITIITAWTMFVGSRLLTTYKLQSQISTQELQIEQMRTQIELFDKIHEIRLEGLEREVFGEHDPATPIVIGPEKPTVIHKVEPWQKNRDEELRKRIKALEEWRLQQDGLPKVKDIR